MTSPQLLTEASVVYSVAVKKLSAAVPSARKIFSHSLTAILLLASVAGFYQLGTILSSEFRQPGSPAPTPAVQAAVTAPATAKPAGLSRSAPIRLEIPTISVDAAFTQVGQKADGTLDVPPHDLVGWYTGAPTPGEIGPAIVVGHVDSVTGPAVFWYLEDLKPSDDIRITREDGRVVTFKVEKLETYAQDAFPSAKVYGNINYSGLRLITCEGDFNYATRHYSHNLVVYAKIAP